MKTIYQDTKIDLNTMTNSLSGTSIGINNNSALETEADKLGVMAASGKLKLLLLHMTEIKMKVAVI